MKPYILKPNERQAIRKGGRIVHVIEVDENGRCPRLTKAICGDGPKEKNVRSFTRAGWWHSPSYTVNCPRCLKILSSRNK